MRVYVPMTLPGLAAWTKGSPEEPLPAHAVTPAIREWYIEGDLEELEYAAMLEAARACLDLLAAEPDAPRQRVVVALEVPESVVHPDAGGARSAVRLVPPAGIDAIVSVHVDEPEAAATIEAAIAALPAARSGDGDASFLLDEAEACDLLWYDVSELSDIV